MAIIASVKMSDICAYSNYIRFHIGSQELKCHRVDVLVPNFLVRINLN
jgi:hypothetical protein